MVLYVRFGLFVPLCFCDVCLYVSVVVVGWLCVSFGSELLY